MSEDEKHTGPEPGIIRVNRYERMHPIIFSIVMSVIFLVQGRIDSITSTIMALLLLLGCIFSFIQWWRRLILTEDRLIYRGTFRTRSIQRKDIAGVKGSAGLQYRTYHTRRLKLIPRTAGLPSLSIPVIFLENTDLKKWLEGIPDLDKIREQQRKQKITEEAEALCQMAEEVPVFGKNKAARRQNFQNTNMLFLVLAMMGLALSLLLVLFIDHGPVMLWLPVSITALLLLCIFLQPKKILFFQPTDPNSTASAGFRSGVILGLHGLLICLSAIIATPGDGTGKFLYWAIVPAGLLLLALRHAAPDLRSAATWIQFVAFLILCAASYGTLRMANVFLDENAVRNAPVQIIKIHYVDRGPQPGLCIPEKFAIHFSGPHKRLPEHIGDALQHAMSYRDTASLSYGDGAFSVPWYNITVHHHMVHYDSYGHAIPDSYSSLCPPKKANGGS